MQVEIETIKERRIDLDIHIFAKIEEFFEPFIDVIVKTGAIAIILIKNADTKMQIFILLLLFTVSGNPDAPHITAIAGDNITLNCEVNFPNGVSSPYVVQWWRKVSYCYCQAQEWML